MGWGPVDWVKRVFPEAKFEKKMDFVFLFFLILSTVTEISVEIRKCDFWTYMGSGRC